MDPLAKLYLIALSSVNQKLEILTKLFLIIIIALPISYSSSRKNKMFQS